MPRLIDANKVAQDIRENNRENFNNPDWTSADVCTLLENAPTVDAVEVVHGRWIEYGAGACCSNCGLSLLHQDESNNWGIEPSGFLYCPYCGAKMDGDGNG